MDQGDPAVYICIYTYYFHYFIFLFKFSERKPKQAVALIEQATLFYRYFRIFLPRDNIINPVDYNSEWGNFSQ